MKKLITIITFISFLGVFSACEEEEIVPQDQLNNTEGAPIDDPGQWD